MTSGPVRIRSRSVPFLGATSVALLGLALAAVPVAACSGATSQEVLGNDPASTSGGTSGTSGTSGTTGKTCADLATCCAAITDASIKSACEQTKTAAAGNDASCNTYYNSFKTYCP